MNIRPIHTEEDYEKALARIDEILNAAPNTSEFDELDVLSSLVELYEKENFPVDPPDPIEAIKVRMEDLGLTRKDLESFIGSRSHVSEILNRQRPLSISMIRSLSKHLGIPGDVLIQPYPLTKKAKDRPSGPCHVVP
jgi:HTH-type transcriptional regulator / antitoxin HigA